MKNSKIYLKIFLAIMISSLSFTAMAVDKIMAVPKPGKEDKELVMSVDEMPQILRGFTPRIVGGSIAGRNEFPEFAVLYIDGEVLGLDPDFIFPACGGSLIASNKILTAAHCTDGIDPRFLFIVPNFYAFNEVTFSDVILVSSKAEHPNFDADTFDSDVSVLTLRGASNTPLATLYGGVEDLTGSTATVIGIGSTSEGGPIADVLRKVNVPVVSNQVCRAAYEPISITSRMICAGLVNGGRDSCQGDSGGPLTVDIEGQRAQAGIVSFGVGCARPNFFGVYSRISEFTGFIQRQAPSVNFAVEGGESPTIVPILPLLLDEDE